MCHLQVIYDLIWNFLIWTNNYLKLLPRQFNQELNNKLIECRKCACLFHQLCHTPLIKNEEIEQQSGSVNSTDVGGPEDAFNNNKQMVWYLPACQRCQVDKMPATFYVPDSDNEDNEVLNINLAKTKEPLVSSHLVIKSNTSENSNDLVLDSRVTTTNDSANSLVKKEKVSTPPNWDFDYKYYKINLIYFTKRQIVWRPRLIVSR